MRTRASTAQAVRQTLQQRGADATHQLRAALDLPADLNDTTILGTALAEAAAGEVRLNAQFRAEVRRRYDELTALRSVPAKRQPAKPKVVLGPLVAIRHTGAPIDPFAPPDPKTLMYVYGDDKLGRALHEYTLDDLKRTSATIEAAHPGTKPRSKAVKQAVIDYIVRYSTGA
jgi:hypothetical protein